MADFSALKTAIQTYIKQNGNEEITGEILQEILLSVVTTLGDTAINNLVTALADEVAARQNADGTLQQNITNEATARGNADTALSNRLGSTITAENTAAEQIGEEAEAREAADTALQGLIDGITDNIENGYVYAGIATPSSTPTMGKVFYLALTAGTYTNFGSTVVTQGINILKYNGSAWSLDAFIGIDDTPTPNSPKLVKSGGVFDKVMTDGSAFDISAYFASGGTLATYADLSAALTALNSLSADYKRGGMSIKFVQSSDNNYVQARCMAQSFTTDVTQWQGVDDEPTAGSDNMVKSGGVSLVLGDMNLTAFVAKNVLDITDEDYTPNKIINDTGGWHSGTYNNYATTGYIRCAKKQCFRPANASSSFPVYACFFNSNKQAIIADYINGSVSYIEVPDDSNIAYVRISALKTVLNGCLYNSKDLFTSIVGFNEYVLHVSKIDGYENRLNTVEVNLGSCIVKTDEVFDFKKGYFIQNIFNDADADIVEGKYIDSSGSLVSASSVFTTGYIPCKAGDVLNFNERTSTSSIICAFYNSSKEFIRQWGEGSLSPYTTVPNDDNIAYVRLCPSNLFRHRALYNYNGVIYAYAAYSQYVALLDNIEFSDNTDLKTILSTIKNDLSLKQGLITTRNVLNRDDADYLFKYILYNGVPTSGYNQFEVSGYIPAKAGDAFRLNKVTNETNYKTYWTWYDSNKQLLGYYNNNNSGDYPYLLVPDNANIAYVRVSIHWDEEKYSYNRANVALYKTTDFLDVVKPYNEEFIINRDTVFSDIGSVKENIVTIKNNIQSLEETIGIWKYAVDKLICFGDSITDGYYPIDGVSPTHLIQQGFPYYIQRMLNTNVENAGKAGSYPYMCYNDKLPTYTLTDYNVFFIWLGSNGGIREVDDSYELPTTPPQSYAAPEVQYVYYKRLIEAIQAANTDCKIFLGNVFVTGEIATGVTPATKEETNSALETLASTYGCEIINLSDLGPSSHPELHAGVSNTHFGKAGNIYLANRICKTFETYFGSNILNCEFGLNDKASHNP